MPIAFADVLAARERLRPFLSPAPVRRYPTLDASVGHGISVVVKHAIHQPTQAFNNPDKNAAIRGWGATLVEEGSDYDASVEVADRLVRERDLTLVYSTNNRDVMLLRLRPELAGKAVGIVMSGGNCDAKTAARALAGA